MPVTISEVLLHTAGLPLQHVTLSAPSGFEVQVLTWGATVTSVRTPDAAGQLDQIVLGFPDLAGFLENVPYLGATCGRYANRIARGRFTLGDQTYELPCNNGPNHLHGGLNGLTRRSWSLIDTSSSESEDRVTLRALSGDGDEGYPGELRVDVTFVLQHAGELEIHYEAESNRPTVLNLTNHAYWNLGGVSERAGTILEHQLQLDCDQFVPVDEVQIPTGQLAEVAGTPMDFREPSKLGERISEVQGGYDHCYVINDADGTLKPAAKVVDPASGRTMSVETTEPGIQLYTGNFLDGSRECGGHAAHTGFCLECQHFPDSPNQPSFPSTELYPGEQYRQTTIHRFGVQSERAD